MYSARQLDDLFRRNLQAEARKVLATGPLVRLYENALNSVGEHVVSLIGGARAYPVIGRIDKYREFKETGRLDVPSKDGRGGRTISIDWRNLDDPTLNEDDSQRAFEYIRDLFTDHYAYTDFDVAMLVVNDGTLKEDGSRDRIRTKLHDSLRESLRAGEMKDDVAYLAKLELPADALLADRHRLERFFDLRPDFILEQREFLKRLRTHAANSRVFGARTDGPPTGVTTEVIEVSLEGEERPQVRITFPPHTELKIGVGMRVAKETIYANIHPNRGGRPFLTDTFNDGALIVGNIPPDIDAAIVDVNGLHPDSPRKIRSQPIFWGAFLDYIEQLEGRELLNGLLEAKEWYTKAAAEA